MNVLKSTGFLFLFMLITACSGHGGLDVIRIENDCFIKSFHCSSKKADIIRPVYSDREDKQVFNGEGTAYFEFIIGGEQVSSENKLWIFEEIKERPLQNGGIEYTLEFEGGRGAVKGLGLTIRQQIFPASTLVREQLVLHSRKEEFTLNKKEGALHFIFPGYSLKLKEGAEPESVELRLASWEKRRPDFDPDKGGNHMYYPELNVFTPGNSSQLLKGPIHILSSNSLSWITAYEHASQDHTGGLLDEEKTAGGKLINDAMQGTKGVFNFPLKDEDFHFLGISVQKERDQIAISIEALRGAYLEGETIDPEHPYESVWTATAFYENSKLERGKEIIREYLGAQICENPVSRKPEFYYNTWGMQREDPGKPLRGILSYDRIFEEIEYAAQMGVDIFVLDDGWEQAMGIWTPHKDRFPEGLRPIKEKLDDYGIKMGLWFSPMGIDSTTSRYREHPEWVIRDSEGNPIQAQWGHPAFDFVSDFFDLFVEDCKAMIDQGCLFMKWDAINTFYSSLPGLHHGSETDPPEERRARYEYLLPIYVAKAMEVLTEYEPELVIEIDLTEARRVMMGLAPLSQGKLFFMNNGASGYNDYSSYRTMSMRTIANEYAGLIPLELFTYASYPQNIAGSMEYNVSSSLLAGHGFWGDLSLMSREELDYVGRQVGKSKRVLPYVSESLPQVQGRVGDSPEIYRVVNEEESAGQIIAFSRTRTTCRIEQSVNPARLLGVLNHPYSGQDGTLDINLSFPEEESAKALFILPNEGAGVSIQSSSVALSDIRLDENSLFFETEAPGEQEIIWPFTLGEPKVEGIALTQVKTSQEENAYRIHTAVSRQGEVEISGEQSALLDNLQSPILFKGDSVTAYRDPAVLFEDGKFYLFFTLVEIEPDSMIYSYTVMSTSRDLKEWSPIQKLTPRNQSLNYCSPGNVIRYKDEWILCLQTYPRVGYHMSEMPRYGDSTARVFIMRSTDLEAWSEPELIKVKGPNVAREDMGRMIDPYLLQDIHNPEKYWCFYKQNGVSMSWSNDLVNWNFHSSAHAGENVCVLKEKGQYLLFHSPHNGIGIKHSNDLNVWADRGELITLGQEEWPWARGRVTAGAVLDMRKQPEIQNYLMFFHGSGPGDERLDFDRNSSIGLAWSKDLEYWSWPN